ncbi:MAG TPA: hypothetical protein ENJ45_01010 [Phaeodactylibacter sp.]|nr:hypothetical protein [Phaeodactylibacter sp.]
MRHITLLPLCFLFVLACKQDPTSHYKPLDLMPHGIPITIQAPPNATVKVSDLTVMKDITVKKDPDFYIQIYSSMASSKDLPSLKKEYLEEVKQNPYFSKIIEDKTNGFIYEKQVDSTMSYAFKYIYVQGDREYTFQNGILGIFDLEQINNMYKAVQQK